MEMEAAMNYWIFKSNPDIYDVESSILAGNPPRGWKVSRYRNEIKSGDLIFLWRTGNNRGIVALFESTSDPYYIPPNPNEPYWSDLYKVDVHLRKHFAVLDADFLKQLPGLQNLSTFHGYQAGTNFKVTAEEGKILMKLIENQ